MDRLQVVADLDRYDCDEKSHCDNNHDNCPDPVLSLTLRYIRFSAFHPCSGIMVLSHCYTSSSNNNMITP